MRPRIPHAHATGRSSHQTGSPLPYPGSIAPRRGWKAPGGGRAAHVDPGTSYLGTSSQVAGLYPFMQARGLPSEGVPLGPDILTHEMVCLDPGGWVGRLITNCGVWIQGQPGAGKSALAKRLIVGLCGYGYGFLCPADVKGEYTPLTEALGGQVIRVGRGLDKINPLDAGPLGRHVATLPVGERDVLSTEIAARRQEVLLALLSTEAGLGRRADPAEAAAVSAAVRLAAERNSTDPIIPDILVILRDPPQELLTRLMADSPADYLDQVRPVVNAIGNLIDGPLQGLFDGPTTTPLSIDSPAISVDLSALLTAGEQVIAAGMLATWAHVHTAIDTARAFGLMNRPLVNVGDELWRVLAAGDRLISAINTSSRLNRARGEVLLLVTHSVNDGVGYAAELLERCDILALAAQPTGELQRVAEHKPLTDAEMDLVASWASPTATGTDATPQSHPGRGLYLIRLGQGLGVPVRLVLTDTEIPLYDTDARIRAAAHPEGTR